jgi:SAM-dependent methyltransferase
MPGPSRPYLLGTRGDAVTRLEIQGEIFDKQSRPFLANWVKPNMNVLEVGCGAGNTSVILAALLDGMGHLIATDLEQSFVDITATKVAAQGFKNVTVRQCALENVAELSQTFDLIYGRAVLHQVTDAKRAIATLNKQLVRSGLMLFEEPVMDDFSCYPPDAAFATLVDLYIRLGLKTQHDFLVGKKLEALYIENRLDVIHYGFIQSVLLTDHERQIIPMLAHECSKEFIDEGLIQSSTLTKLIGDLEALIKTNAAIAYVKFGQIVGKCG